MITFTTEANWGHDTWSRLPHRCQGIHALRYSTNPAPTLTRYGGTPGYITFPFKDDDSSAWVGEEVAPVTPIQHALFGEVEPSLAHQAGVLKGKARPPTYTAAC
jgi:hypothetical protein